jgi:hypothetical protein
VVGYSPPITPINKIFSLKILFIGYKYFNQNIKKIPKELKSLIIDHNNNNFLTISQTILKLNPSIKIIKIQT